MGSRKATTKTPSGWPGTDDPQRVGYHAGRQVHFAVAGPAPVLSSKYDYETAPPITSTRLRPIKRKTPLTWISSSTAAAGPGLTELVKVYEADGIGRGPVDEDEDILNYDDVGRSDAYVATLIPLLLDIVSQRSLTMPARDGALFYLSWPGKPGEKGGLYQAGLIFPQLTLWQTRVVALWRWRL